MGSQRHHRVRSTLDLGYLVRVKRKELGVTQVQAAGLAGVGVRFLSELERGKDTLEVGKVLQVLNAVGLDLQLRGRS